MKVVSPVYHKAKAQLRFNLMMNLGLAFGLLIAFYFISEDLAKRGF